MRLQPWEAQPDETEMEFGLFQHYLFMGANRDLEALASFSSLDPQNLKKLAEKNRWESRAKSFDRFLQQEAEKYLASERLLIAMKALGLLRNVLDVLERALIELKGETSFNLNNVRTVTSISDRLVELAKLVEAEELATLKPSLERLLAQVTEEYYNS